MIRRLFRWGFRLLVLVILLFIACLLLMNTVTRDVMESRIKKQTGFDVKIGHVDVGILNPHFRIENMTLYNPAEFGGSPALEIPELCIEYDGGDFYQSLASHNLHCTLVRINVTRINLVENQSGKLNLAQLFHPGSAGTATASSAPATHPGVTKLRFTGIDTLNLSVGKVTFMQLKQPRRVSEVNLDIHNEVFTNVTSAHALDGFVSLFKSTGELAGGTKDPGLQAWLDQLFSPQKKK